MAKPWQNADGLQVTFGNYWSDPTNFVNKPRVIATFGAKKQLLIPYDLTRIPTGTTSFSADLNNDGTADGFSDGDVRLPANSSVTECSVYATTAATGGTSFTVGTYKKDGSTISATSLVTATEGVIANINAIGKRVFGAGALVSTSAGTAGVGTSNAYIGITTSGTFTAGTGYIIVTFFDPTTEAVAD